MSNDEYIEVKFKADLDKEIATYDSNGEQTCNMMGYISDKTLVNGYKWEEIKDQLSFTDFGSEEDLYLALRARQDELGDTSEVLYPTLYDQNTRNRCTIEFKITAIF